MESRGTAMIAVGCCHRFSATLLSIYIQFHSHQYTTTICSGPPIQLNSSNLLGSVPIGLTKPILVRFSVPPHMTCRIHLGSKSISSIAGTGSLTPLRYTYMPRTKNNVI